MTDFKVIDWDELPRFDKDFLKKGSAISIGGFDGLHLGHQVLLEELKKKAGGFLKGVLTFYVPPAYILSASKRGLISTLRLKKEKLKRLGFDFVVLVDFSSNFAKMRAENFVDLLKKYLNLKVLVVGSDFHFGHNRLSSVEDMRYLSSKFSFSFEALKPLFADGKMQKISSSTLRASIYDGNITYANSLLGEAFTVDLLDLKPYEADGRKFSFRRKDIMQVLPRDGEFEGIVCFSASFPEEKVAISIDENYLRLVFENTELNKDEPYFDILKFV
ncbi:MAG: hypothetical protein ACTTJ6_04905 [Treponema sp.]